MFSFTRLASFVIVKDVPLKPAFESISVSCSLSVCSSSFSLTSMYYSILKSLFSMCFFCFLVKPWYWSFIWLMASSF